MGYRDIYKESNEQAEERFSLVMERIAEIAEETEAAEDTEATVTPTEEAEATETPEATPTEAAE